MEVFGGFMMMVSIIGFFLTVIWFILPFVIFNIKGRVDRTLQVVEDMEKRLAALERNLAAREAPAPEVPVREVPVTTEEERREHPPL